MRSGVLPAIGKADTSDHPPEESEVPAGWTGHLVPNFSQWQPGDVVLVAGDGGVGGLAIQSAQKLSRRSAVRAAARFTHAAIYVGDGLVIDATFGNPIARRSVWFYCQYRDLVLRRVPARGIPAADIEAIAAAAARHLGEPYSVSEAVFSKLIPNTQPDPQRLYCSTFVGLVVTEATGLFLAEPREHRPLHPATLVTHPQLEEVMLEWRPLPVRAGRRSRPI